MLSARHAVTSFALVALASGVFAQTGPMITPSAFIEAPGHFGLDVLGLTIGKEPNYLTYAEKGTIVPRTRIDGPVFRLYYVPSERAEFAVEFNAQTFAVNDPRYKATISDFGNATLRAKLGFAKGETSKAPAVAVQFQVTLPNTSFGNGLDSNTLRFESTFLLGYKTEKLTLNGSLGIAIQDEPLRLHEQRDFVALSGGVSYKMTETLDAFADAGGYFGDGVPGAIAKREARAGVQYHHTTFGYPTTIYAAGRRGLVDFQGKWGVVVGFSTTIRAGARP